jgi:hypothetical protein
MPDQRAALERAERQFSEPKVDIESVRRRSSQRRRNQRISAGVVGIAVFVAAVWIVTSVGSFDRTQTPAVPGGAGTGPTGTPTVAPDAGWDGIGFPPEGTAPSTPKEGELVAHHIGNASYVFVYADGRVISGGGIFEDFDGTAREQRLTPEGVELVRSGAVEQTRFLLSSAPVPAGAWEDAKIKPYVPSRYAVCYWMERGGDNISPSTVPTATPLFRYDYVSPSTVLRFFPAQAREILAGKDHTYPPPSYPLECSEVTTDEARALDNILRDVRVVDAQGDQIAWQINTLLPHGEWAFMFG